MRRSFTTTLETMLLIVIPNISGHRKAICPRDTRAVRKYSDCKVRLIFKRWKDRRVKSKVKKMIIWLLKRSIQVRFNDINTHFYWLHYVCYLHCIMYHNTIWTNFITKILIQRFYITNQTKLRNSQIIQSNFAH